MVLLAMDTSISSASVFRSQADIFDDTIGDHVHATLTHYREMFSQALLM